MNNPGLENVATFLKVIETGGFAAAGREIGVTQSTVSRRISELERHLGVRLLERTTRRVLLTEPGARYGEAARAFLRDLTEAGANLDEASAGAGGPIRITLPQGYGHRRVLPALAAFSERHPAARFDIDLSDRYVDILKENYDFAVRLAEPQESGVVAKVVGQVRSHLCASPGFLRDHPVTAPEDLRNDKCLVQRTYAANSTWTLMQDGVVKRIALQPKMVLNGVYSVYAMALAGMGVALLPDFLVEADLRAGRLVPVPVAVAIGRRPVCLVWPRHKAGLRRVRALGEFLESALGDARPGRP